MIAALLASAVLAAPAPRLGIGVGVEAPTAGTVVSVAADIVVASEVWGDVVALGGDVELRDGAHVHGDVVAVGGAVRGDGWVEGRAVGLAALGALSTRSPAARRDASSVAGLACLRVGGWVVLASLLMMLGRRLVRRTAEELERQPWRTAAAGGLVVVVWLAATVLAIAVAGSPLGAGLTLAAVGGFLAAKIVGLTALAWLVGRRLSGRLPGWLRGEAARTGVAMLVLAVASLVPLLGAFAWMLASVAGLGAVAGVALGARPVALALSRIPLR